MIELIVYSVLAVLLLVVGLRRALRAKTVTERISRWSEKSGLAITDQVEPMLRRRYRASGVGHAVGVALGAESGGLFAIWADGRSYEPASGLLIQSFWLVGGGLGALIGGAIGARVARPTGPRIARARAVSIDDYVPPVERRVAAALGVLALLVAVAPLIHGVARETPGAIIAGAVGVGSILGGGLLARRFVTRPQPTGSAVALAWDDALRAMDARTLIQVSAAAALLSLVESAPLALSRSGGSRDLGQLQIETMFVLVVLLIAGGIWSSRQRPARYFLRRLWPGTASQLAENERVMEVQR